MPICFYPPGFCFFWCFCCTRFLLSFQNSFLDINVLNPENTRFVGLGNWLYVVNDGKFWLSLFNVLFNQIIFVTLSFVVALMAALMLNEIKFLASLFRTILFIPVITSITVAMIIFDFLSGPAGPIQENLLSMGILNNPVFLEIRTVAAHANDCGVQCLEMVWCADDHFPGGYRQHQQIPVRSG